MRRWLKTYIYGYFLDVASLASIIGLVIAFCAQTYAVIIALVAFCIVLLILLIGVLYSLRNFIHTNYKEEYRRITSSYVFQTDDGIKSTFEMYRLIQSKRPVLNQIEYKYKWSGSKLPKMSSDNQIVEQLPSCCNPTSWDKAILKLKKPLAYNESTVLHIKTENDDFDNVAKPWLECKLSSPIELMQFRVLLAYKPRNYTEKALFQRRKIDVETGVEYETIESVDFNQQYKQYFFIKLNPEPGYVYRLIWKK